MLGKQGWEFLSSLTPLFAVFLKAQYFPSCNYLNAQLGHNPSYVWHSILRARFIIQGGARWSIESGASISILNKPWLPNGECISGDTIVLTLLRKFFKCRFLLKYQRTVSVGKWRGMVGILFVVLTGYVSLNSLTLLTFDAQGFSLESGSSKFLRKLRILSGFWSLWKHRNLRVWDDVTKVSVVVVERAKNLVVDWQIANFPSAADSTPLQQAQQSVGEGSSSMVCTSAFVASAWQ
ncbi:hypothetical protein MTR_4g415270 [Medicago truncatula]|uniref:Transmembrane protein n=1 Tax=Medicago truncatula TaxID=3880 RepID=A0A072UGT6_MEDTR|nr:hypothetical protein MTR_4g415270 [Medicago truncatula]